MSKLDNSKLWIAFDPGYTTGWCILGPEGMPRDLGQVKWDDLANFLKKETRTFEAVIIEEYKIFRKKAMQHAGSDVKTSQVIGKLRFWAELNDTPVILQPANILPMAQRWSQVEMPKNHSVSHQISAYLHGAYYLMKNQIAPTALERKALETQKEKS